MSSVKVNTRFQFVEELEFPLNATEGTICFKGGILYIYSKVNGILTWYPTNKPKSSHVHTQGIPQLIWTIYHGLGTKDVNCVVYDEEGNAQYAQVQSSHDPAGAEGKKYQVTVSLSEAISGYAVLFGVENLSAPSVQSEHIEAQVITINGQSVALETDVDAVRAIADGNTVNIGDLASLETLNKSAVVSAINEVKGLIDSLDSTYSTDSETAALIQQVNEAWVQSDGDLTALVNTKLSTSAYTASDVLAKIKTIDGSLSGLDADLLDGKHASEFALSGHGHTMANVSGLSMALDQKVDSLVGKGLSTNDYTDAEQQKLNQIQAQATKNATDTDLRDRSTHTGEQDISTITGLTSSLSDKLESSVYTASDVLNKIKTVDGALSDLDADLLDGKHASEFALSGHGHTMANVSGLSTALDQKVDSVVGKGLSTNDYTDTEQQKLNQIQAQATKNATDTDLRDRSTHTGEQDISTITGLIGSLSDKLESSTYTAVDVLSKIKTVDGALSGLDADLLDGKHAADFALSGHSHVMSEITGLVSALSDKMDGSQASSFAALSHSHAMSEITGLITALADKLDVTATAADASKLGAIQADQYITVNDSIDCGVIV